MPAIHGDDALPGSDLVRTGLADVAAGRVTIEGLLVQQARTRLRELGYEMRGPGVDRPDARLYDLIEREVGPRRAHGRYNALRRRLSSFIRSARIARVGC
jgi:hypothetical protein